LKAVGEWMKVNGEAIYDTSASPFKSLPWGRCTKQVTVTGTTLYLHVFKWPQDGKLQVPGLRNKVIESYLLTPASGVTAAVSGANGVNVSDLSLRKKLEFLSGSNGVTVSVPAEAPDPISSTVVLKIKGAPMIDQPMLSQDYDGSVSLAGSEAHLHGSEIQTESSAGHDNIGYWTNPEEWCEWQFRVATAGKFDVTADMAAEDASSLELSVGENKLRASATATGGYSKYKTVKLGTLEIASAGVTTLALHPVKEDWHPVNVRSLRLAPSP